MNLFLQILLCGLAIGIVHYAISGVLYLNPLIAGLYEKATEGCDVIKKRKSSNDYLMKQFLGTQVEIYFITAGYLFLRQYLPFAKLETAIIIALIFTCIRVYERFWNMLIQTNYPKNLLIIELVNGIIGTFVIVLGLSFFPEM